MKHRITIVIIVTLLLGFVIGMLTSAQLRHQRMRPVRTFASEQYFREHFYRIVEPSEEQKIELDGIIKSYADDFNKLNRQFRNDFESLMDEQWRVIKPVLNKEQIEKLEEFERNRRKAMKEFRDKRGTGDRGRHDRDTNRSYRRDSDRDTRDRRDSDRDTRDRRDSDRDTRDRRDSDRDTRDRRYYDRD
ncbi:MAG: hypothetical protein U5K32_10190 [Bacteroidales bacterium]|nr:hypothetical protein [Bacteroidales bacterium]